MAFFSICPILQFYRKNLEKNFFSVRFAVPLDNVKRQIFKLFFKCYYVRFMIFYIIIIFFLSIKQRINPISLILPFPSIVILCSSSHSQSESFFRFSFLIFLKILLVISFLSLNLFRVFAQRFRFKNLSKIQSKDLAFDNESFIKKPKLV